jgi:hypothetical protein
MKKDKYIMVEFLNDQNAWEWFGVYKNFTASEAKKACLDTGIDNEDVRAYEIEVIEK